MSLRYISFVSTVSNMNKSTPDPRLNGTTQERVARGLKRRIWAERRFRFYGLLSISIGLLALVVLFSSIISKGYRAFEYTQIGLEIEFKADVIDPSGERKAQALEEADYASLWKAAIAKRFPDVEGRQAKRNLYGLVSGSAEDELKRWVKVHPDKIGSTQIIWLSADDSVDVRYKAGQEAGAEDGDERVVQQRQWIAKLEESQQLRLAFNRTFFQRGDSREPESAGILGALMGSLLTLLVTLGLSLPVGMAAAIYLEEFSTRNRWTDLIEVNINNLAAVPSIVFGLLGLAVFINLFGVPRSSPLVGGLVLTLMTLPVIIISGRSALKSVPPSVREAAWGIGASSFQTVFHHVLPLAMPGMLTGAIIGMARALGESAPLLMVGMVAFIVDVPGAITDPATVLPVQIYLWADSPERAFTERTAAAILILLLFLIMMNGAAVYLRKKFERRW